MRSAMPTPRLSVKQIIGLIDDQSWVFAALHWKRAGREQIDGAAAAPTRNAMNKTRYSVVGLIAVAHYAVLPCIPGHGVDRRAAAGVDRSGINDRLGCLRPRQPHHQHDHRHRVCRAGHRASARNGRARLAADSRDVLCGRHLPWHRDVQVHGLTGPEPATSAMASRTGAGKGARTARRDDPAASSVSVPSVA